MKCCGTHVETCSENALPKEAISRPSNKVPQLPSGVPRVFGWPEGEMFYCQDVDIAEVRPPDSSNLGVSPWAIDPKITERLWTLSEDPMRVKSGS